MQAFFKDQYARRIFLWLALLVLLLVLLFNPAVGFGVTTQKGVVRSGMVKILGNGEAFSDSCPAGIGPRGA